MLPALYGTLGISSFLYLIYKYFWSKWYLDWLYQKKGQVVVDSITGLLSKGLYLIDVFEDVARKTPDKTFIIFDDQRISYKEMDLQANKAARAAIELGIKPGSTVAVLIYNEPAIIWTYLGMYSSNSNTL